MRELLTVFSGTAESARDLAAHLEAKGVRSLVHDQQGPVSSPRDGRSFFSVVQVPSNDVESATQAVRKWELQNRDDSHQLANRIVKVVASTFVVPALWLIAYLVAPDSMPDRSIAWLCAVWAVVFVVFAQIENQRNSQERITLPRP